tara:strand:+ start:462 stop:1679 length:1218 start_codon:yes stop_codon:yes gene_type:complete
MPKKKKSKEAETRDAITELIYEKELSALPKEKYEISHKGDETKIWSVSTEIRTLEEALAKAEIDTDVFEVKECTVNQYQMPLKIQENGEDRIHREVMWQVKVVLRRKVKQWITDGIELVHERIKKHAPKYTGMNRLKKLKDPHLYEISIYDSHFGKFAWQPETGQNYDLKIAKRIYQTAFADLLARANGFQIDRFLFPVGNDFMHFDSHDAKTTAGTPMGDSADGRYSKVFETCFEVCLEAIDVMANIAPVDVVLVQGNHDKHASYHVCFALKQAYKNHPRVNVDSIWCKRKYVKYGTNLIGLAHGDAVRDKWTRLPTLMATEKPQDWADSTHREFHLGHVHSRAKREMLPVAEHEGVIVRTLPSLSATDSWHYSHGYTSRRAAESYLYSKADGYVGHFSVNAKE